MRALVLIYAHFCFSQGEVFSYLVVSATFREICHSSVDFLIARRFEMSWSLGWVF